MKKILFCALLLPAGLFSAELNISLVSRGTGLRLLESSSEKVEIITRQEVEALPGASLDEKLSALIPGANVSRQNGIYSYRSNLALRGFSSAEQGRVLVLLDGAPLNASATGSVNWNMASLGDVERIELFKGAGSFMYGSNAVAGVINIITAKPGPGFLASQTYGTYDTYLSKAKAGFQKGGFSLDLNGSLLDSGGYVSAPAELRNAYTVKKYARENAVSVKTSWKTAGSGELETQYLFYGGVRGEGSKIKTARGASRTYANNFLRNKWSYKGEKFYFENLAYYNNEKYLRLNEYYRSGVYYRVDSGVLREDLALNSFASFSPAAGTEVLFGLDYRKGGVDGSDKQLSPSFSKSYDRGRLAQYAAYAQAEKSFFSGFLKTLAGLRYDSARFYDGYFYNPGAGYGTVNGALPAGRWEAFSPKLLFSLAYGGAAEQYFSYSRGFRPSGLEDMCLSLVRTTKLTEANPGLKPEKVDTFETGLKTNFFKGFYFDPSVYVNYGRDFIYEVNTGVPVVINSSTYYVYKKANVTDVKIYGMEFPARFFLGDFSAYAGYAFSVSKIMDFPANRSLEGKSLAYSPKSQFSAFLSQKIPGGFEAGAGWKYKSRQFTDDANTPDLSLGSYSLFSAAVKKTFRRGLEAELKAENLTDKRYTESSGDLAPGRTFNLTLKSRF